MAATMPSGSGYAMTGVAHLPSLERPDEVTRLVADFVQR
jgi:pimeloyl-ACP methyl ester carboxylesterase